MELRSILNELIAGVPDFYRAMSTMFEQSDRNGMVTRAEFMQVAGCGLVSQAAAYASPVAMTYAASVSPSYAAPAAMSYAAHPPHRARRLPQRLTLRQPWRRSARFPQHPTLRQPQRHSVRQPQCRTPATEAAAQTMDTDFVSKFAQTDANVVTEAEVEKLLEIGMSRRLERSEERELQRLQKLTVEFNERFDSVWVENRDLRTGLEDLRSHLELQGD
eukprot:TRINITY_DN13209_c0_g1_i1.p1 TRINITY_DN13209_c0_g1~~TRINITY_DN13209_c0_g1_i1.p1  ORF type:complete len:218 (+),score=29.66 TRINITY_DN13209_c0_g1_i1:137-790(+)